MSEEPQNTPATAPESTQAAVSAADAPSQPQEQPVKRKRHVRATMRKKPPGTPRGKYNHKGTRKKSAGEEYRHKLLEKRNAKALINKRKAGRPSTYDPSLADQAYQLALAGYKDTDIARILTLSWSTFYQYTKTKPDFAAKIVEGREKMDGKVAVKLIDKCLGHVKTTVTEYPNGKKLVVKEDQPPDLQSIKYWNAIRPRWQEKTSTEITGLNGLNPTTITLVKVVSTGAQAQVTEQKVIKQEQPVVEAEVIKEPEKAGTVAVKVVAPAPEKPKTRFQTS